MELAIRIVVVLFVAVVVAGLVIMFAKRVLVTPEVGPPQAPKENYVEVDHITTDQIEALVKVCHAQAKESLDRKSCFSVRSLDRAPNVMDVAYLRSLNLDGDPATADLEVTASSGDSAIFILFDGKTGKVEVN